MKRFFALTWIIIPFFLQAQSQKLNVYFCNLKSNEGQIRVTLFAGKENYVKKTPVHSAVLAIENHEAVWEMDSVGTGEYIVAAFHDENKNGKLDLGTMGIPVEGYAFSNNTKAEMGPPDPDKMLFEVKKDESTTQQHLKMVYFDFSILKKQ